MAYGSHHFLTNFKFQCVAREHLFFRDVIGSEEGKQAHDEHFALTHEGYTRNFAPVEVGGRVAVLVSLERMTRSSVRMCFRVIREDGAPVCAGFQTMVCVSRETGASVPPPEHIRSVYPELREQLSEPDFAERIVAGRSSEIFAPELVELAVDALARPDFPAEGELVGAGARAEPLVVDGSVFVFPGQGSYDPEPLRAVLREGGEGADFLRRADEITRRALPGPGLLALLEDPSRHDELLRQWPDLGQVAIFLLGVLSARGAMERGLEPALLMGHSMGELAALCVGGVFPPEQGVELVCARVQSLRAQGPGLGGMLALLGPVDAARELLSGRPDVCEAVLNHDEQLVVSGRFEALTELEREAASAGLQTRRIRSPFPFHSPILQAAVDPFASMLSTMSFEPPRLPVYSPTDARLVDESWVESAAVHIAEHFTRPLSFLDAVQAVHAAGARHFVECGGRSVLAGIVRRVLVDELELRLEAASPSPEPVSDGPEASCPIAIVGMGCILPGAADPTELWSTILGGESQLSDAGLQVPELAEDFLSKAGDSVPVPDKTYTLLGGWVRDFEGAEGPGETRAQAFLAAALEQCLAQNSLEPGSESCELWLGSTADGSREYDEALIAQALRERVPAGEGAGELIEAIEALSDVDPLQLAPRTSARAVVERVLGPDVRVALIDAACASSLYALDVGARALVDERCELALCGGWFAPGPANSCLFSQFSGLSGVDSRPFDRAADGVVFGEGATVLALRRLPDALARGERVLGVIRGIGTSSDGKSPAVNVPSSDGQELAMRRAWQRAGLDPGTADYVEAHATSTPVGDAVEFQALRSVFSRRAAAPVEIGSIKGLIGHTGWAAGAASVIKMCLAFEAQRIPPQLGYATPNERIDLGDSFNISTEAREWPRPQGHPRRAGVNGFGFGGSNAHVVLEQYDPDFHTSFAATPHEPGSLVVVGSRASAPVGEELELPPGRPVLPDVVDHMDRAQVLALRLAHEVLGSLGPVWERERRGIGVFLGLEGKTRLSEQTNLRIYRDRLARLLPDSESSASLLAGIDELQASGPYTLPGSMPNVCAGRVAQFFELMGPNAVLDTGPDSMFDALRLAEQTLREGTCRIALAGKLSGEEACLFAVTTPEIAAECGLEVEARLDLKRMQAAAELHEALSSPGVPVLRAAPSFVECALPVDACAEELSGRVLVLCDAQLEGWEELLPGTEELLVLGVGDVDLSSDESIRAELLERGVASFDTVVVARQLDGLDGLESTAADAFGGGLLDLLFAVTRELYEGLRCGAVRLGTLCLGAVDGRGDPHAYTGLLGGFVRSLARELPEARCCALATSSVELERGLEQLRLEWSASDGPAERIHHADQRGFLRLHELEELSEGDSPQLDSDSVVVATGGARGVTAVLVEALLREYACTVVLVGRSDPGAVSAEVAAMDDEAFHAFEPSFYRERRAAESGESIPQIKRAFERLQAAREAARTLDELQALPGQAHYAVADVTDVDAVAALLADVREQHGRVDLVVHGAGLQQSVALSKKKLEGFRSIIATKLGGLHALAAATDAPIHVLTSAFSFLGNDGQPDYGAANLAMDRIASTHPDGSWSTLAWLGWRGVGMTEGSEYHELARARGLRVLRREEGAALFLELLRGRPRAATSVLIAQGELDWYGEPLLPSPAQGAQGAQQTIARLGLSPQDHPLTDQHRVKGRVTLPGTFGLDLAVRTARSLRPGLQLDRVEDLRWSRFLRLSGQPGELRCSASLVEESEEGCAIDAVLHSDFVHASGEVLERDVEHCRLRVFLTQPTESASLRAMSWEGGALVEQLVDPYHLPDSPVELSGPFANVQAIERFASMRKSRFQLDSNEVSAIAHFATPAVLMDAVCRFAMVIRRPDGRLPVYVPIGCGWFRSLAGCNDARLADTELHLFAAEPREEGEHIRNERAEVRDDEGRVLMLAGDLVARLIGHVNPTLVNP